MIPNLLLYRGSILAIDPKGELAAITCRARHEMGQRCIVLDPFGANGRYASASFNPLDELDVGSPTIVDDAIQIADALIVPNQKDPYWTDNARRMLKMLILYDLWRAAQARVCQSRVDAQAAHAARRRASSLVP